jgi:hypothetical protein
VRRRLTVRRGNSSAESCALFGDRAQVREDFMMSVSLIRGQLFALAAVTSLSAVAQTAPTPAAPPAVPGRSAEAAAALPYQSAMEGYRPFSDEKITNWKKANETVGKIGGWRVYAKEAHEGSSQGQGPAQGSQAPEATSNPHSGHGKH